MIRSSLKIVLLATITATAVLLTAFISTFAYVTAKQYVEEAYVDEIRKFSKLSGDQIAQFFENQNKLAEYLSSNPLFTEAIRDKNFKVLNVSLADLYHKMGFYENIFISTPETNPKIFSDANGKAIGFQWGGQGFDENIKQALAGKKHLSKVGESPITHDPVALLTVPVIDKNKVIAILAFSLSLNSVTEKLVSGIKIGTDGFVAITDFDGVVVGHPDKKLILKLRMNDMDWGKKLMELKSGEYTEYFFKKEKIATSYRLEEYRLSAFAVISKDDISEVVHKMLYKIAAFAFVFLLLSVLVIYYLLNRRLHPLQEARELFRSMASGDLTSELKIYHQDEIGDLSQDTNFFLESLKTSIEEIQKISYELASSAEELSSSSDNFSTTAQSTAASVEEMSATVEEMSAGMENISGSTDNQYKNISEFQQRIRELSSSVNQVGEEIQNTLNQAKMITAQARKGEESLIGMNEMISNILKSSGEMTAIVGIINDIADQTRLLSLNASIEAARAGDAGKGFAVVAEEISKLSEKTASAIKSISSMISKNKGELDSGAQGIKSSTDIIHSIIKNVDSVSAAMDKLYSITGSQKEINGIVLENAHKVGMEAESVKFATDEQKKAVIEINQVIGQINEHTISTASGAEQMSASSKSLSNTAELLRSIAEKFKI